MPSHYPSWGSGTYRRQAGRSRCRRVETHYPSWGSGTRRVADKEALLASSLPLMGIGNSMTCSTIERLRENLITPHGDRELVRTVCRAGCQAHYPSWGSGTRSCPCSHGDLAPGRKLITPHGDREQASGNARAAARTHYPSWGSGTAQVRMAPASTPISLPLMGIGNPPYSASFAPSTPRKRLKIPL